MQNDIINNIKNCNVENIILNQNSDLNITFSKIKYNQYVYTISNKGKQVDILEEMRTNYSK